ncbi:MAG TPA: ATP-grasp ribosomal peptide maturase [Mycobacteriales bacterium]|nr:ATP-grasp ribosomal peptide maturase [Mycobacteriales bacterium]
MTDLVDVGLSAAGTVLVVAGADDAATDAVIRELDSRPVRVARMDVGDFPLGLTLSASMTADGWAGSAATAGSAVDLAEVRSVYYQRPTRFSFPATMSDGDKLFAAAEARLAFGGVLMSLPVLLVNHLGRSAAAEYKPLQLRTASDVGMRVPRTLVTNDHDAVTDFARATSGPVICKTLSSLVLNEGAGPRITYTTPIDATDIDPAAVAATAHLVQQWVPKAYDVRVTMVGCHCFGVAIHANSERAHVDWRADYDAVAYEVVEVPADVIAGTSNYLGCLGLAYGAFDFTVDPDGSWWFLECNPEGRWLWLQEETGLPIAAALADLLAAGLTR